MYNQLMGMYNPWMYNPCVYALESLPATRALMLKLAAFAPYLGT